MGVSLFRGIASLGWPHLLEKLATHKLVNGGCDILAVGAFSSESSYHGPTRSEDAEPEQDGADQQSCFTSNEHVPTSFGDPGFLSLESPEH